MMDLGIALPPAYLAGKPHPHWTRALGSAGEGLSALRGLGVSLVELRSVRGGSDPREAAAAAEAVWNAGLQLSVHGELADGADGALPPALALLLQAAEHRYVGLIVTTHCLASRDAPVDQLRERTVHAARGLQNSIGQAAPGSRLALELNRAKDEIDPGTDYASLVAIRDMAGRPEIGFCWDFGHAISNVRRGLLPGDPPPAFLGGVLQTHIHDLGPDGRTHWPLEEGVVPGPRWAAALAAAGYEGALTLELGPDRFAGAVDVEGAVRGSLLRLDRWRRGVE